MLLNLINTAVYGLLCYFLYRTLFAYLGNYVEAHQLAAVIATLVFFIKIDLNTIIGLLKQ